MENVKFQAIDLKQIKFFLNDLWKIEKFPSTKDAVYLMN